MPGDPKGFTDLSLSRGTDLKPLHVPEQPPDDKCICLHGVAQRSLRRQMRPQIPDAFPCTHQVK